MCRSLLQGRVTQRHVSPGQIVAKRAIRWSGGRLGMYQAWSHVDLPPRQCSTSQDNSKETDLSASHHVVRRGDQREACQVPYYCSAVCRFEDLKFSLAGLSPSLLKLVPCIALFSISGSLLDQFMIQGREKCSYVASYAADPGQLCVSNSVTSLYFFGSMKEPVKKKRIKSHDFLYLLTTLVCLLMRNTRTCWLLAGVIQCSYVWPDWSHGVILFLMLRRVLRFEEKENR